LQINYLIQIAQFFSTYLLYGFFILFIIYIHKLYEYLSSTFLIDALMHLNKSEP